MQKFSILFILLVPLPYPGAAWTRIEFFARYLQSYNYNVAMAGAFSAKTIYQAGSAEWNGIKIYNLIPVIILTNFVCQIFNIICSLLVSFFLFLVLKPKLVIISVPSSGNTLGCYIIARLFKSKVITDYRDEWEDYIYNLSESKVYRAFQQTIKDIMTKCYSASKAVITPTEPFVNSLVRRGVRDVKLIPNGADLSVFKPMDKMICKDKFGISAEDFVLVYSGYIGGYYRVEKLVQALGQFVKKHGTNTKLLIAGHGSALQCVLNLADNIGLRDNVIYLGKIINKGDLVNALCASDVGIIPYDSNPMWRNSLPAKSLEYLACGLPVIGMTYKDSLLGKLIVENNLGLITEPEDTNGLYDAIYRMITDKDFRISASKRSFPFIDQYYNRHKIASEFMKIVLSCVKDDS